MKDKIFRLFNSSIKIKIEGRNIDNFLRRLINNKVNIEKVIPKSYNTMYIIIDYNELDKVLRLKTIYNIKIIKYYLRINISIYNLFI